MNVLIIGQGGREHAIAWKIAQSPKVSRVFVAPGNAGTKLENKTQNIDIKANNIPELLNFAKNNHIDLTIVGPEQPLVEGIVDYFEQNNLNILGPNKKAAQLEGSKAFCKEVLKQAKVPTADYQEFTQVPPALDYLKNKKMPIVIKADGLAAGKGVVITESLEEAQQVVTHFLSGDAFGQASKKIIIEDYLTGQEASFIALISNNTIIPLVSSQDHKARDNNDQGPNTGGMGAYSPTPLVTPELHQKIIENIIQPTINTLKQKNISYNGFLYAGLMIDAQNNINVLEYNCRLGDPETQVILPRLSSDFFELCYLAATKQIDHHYQPQWTAKSAITVVLASKNYPNTPTTGEIISGLEKFTPINNQSSNLCKVFHAATKNNNLENSGNQVITNGGRVLTVTALADTLSQAKDLAYSNINNISWPSLFYRTDIAAKAL